LPIGDGMELFQRESKRNTLSIGEAWETLQIALDIPEPDRTPKPALIEALGGAIKISKSGVLKVAAELAPPRGEGKAKKELMEALAEAGAVQTSVVQTLATRKA